MRRQEVAGVGATMFAAAYVADAEAVYVFVSEERTFSAVGCLFGHGSTSIPKSPFLAIIIP